MLYTYCSFLVPVHTPRQISPQGMDIRHHSLGCTHHSPRHAGQIALRVHGDGSLAGLQASPRSRIHSSCHRIFTHGFLQVRPSKKISSANRSHHRSHSFGDNSSFWILSWTSQLLGTLTYARPSHSVVKGKTLSRRYDN